MRHGDESVHATRLEGVAAHARVVLEATGLGAAADCGRPGSYRSSRESVAGGRAGAGTPGPAKQAARPAPGQADGRAKAPDPRLPLAWPRGVRLPGRGLDLR